MLAFCAFISIYTSSYSAHVLWNFLIDEYLRNLRDLKRLPVRCNIGHICWVFHFMAGLEVNWRWDIHRWALFLLFFDVKTGQGPGLGFWRSDFDGELIWFSSVGWGSWVFRVHNLRLRVVRTNRPQIHIVCKSFWFVYLRVRSDILSRVTGLWISAQEGDTATRRGCKYLCVL